MPGLREVLLIAAIVAGLVILRRLLRGGIGDHATRDRKDPAALETEQCPHCHAYCAAGTACSRADCPYNNAEPD